MGLRRGLKCSTMHSREHGKHREHPQSNSHAAILVGVPTRSRKYSACRQCMQDECQRTLQQRIQVGLHELEGCAHIVEALALHSSQGHT